MNLNWTTFFTITGVFYLCYYLALIVTDALFSRRLHLEQDEIPVLTFTENPVPEKVSLEDFSDSTSDSGLVPASVGLGGVSLKDLFDLARQDAIEFTRAVSF